MRRSEKGKRRTLQKKAEKRRIISFEGGLCFYWMCSRSGLRVLRGGGVREIRRYATE